MNDIQYHLALNHFPIISHILGLFIVGIGFFGRNKSVLHTGLAVFIFSALTSLAAYQTGENAEDMAEQLAGVSHERIEEHEHASERFRNFSVVTGLMALVVLYLSVKRKGGMAVMGTALLVVALVSVYFAREAGTSGGEIRHPEIREGFIMPTGADGAEHYDGD